MSFSSIRSAFTDRVEAGHLKITSPELRFLLLTLASSYLNVWISRRGMPNLWSFKESVSMGIIIS